METQNVTENTTQVNQFTVEKIDLKYSTNTQVKNTQEKRDKKEKCKKCHRIAILNGHCYLHATIDLKKD